MGPPIITFMRAIGYPLSLVSYRGSSRISRLITPMLPDEERTVSIEGAQFAFRLRDFYWNRLLFSGFEYEPELARIFRALSDIDYTLIDCGANYGLWSILVASPAYGSKRAVAVEGSAETFEWLEKNRLLNNNCFEALHKAVYSESGKSLTFSSGPHGARGIGDGDEVVETISLDDLISMSAPNGPVVVKLDVEGAEIKVLSASKLLLERDVLLIYEDHGRDQASEVTQCVLGLGLSVSFLGRDRTYPIQSAQDLLRLKVHPAVGYNLVATKTPEFRNRIV